MHVDRAFFDVHIAAPDAIEQLAARIDTLGVLHEELQQAVFGRAEWHGLLAHGHAMPGRIELELAGFDRRAALPGVERRSTAWMRASSSRGLKGFVT